MIKILKKNSAAKESILQDGFIVLLNKDEDWTSFDVVNKIRKSLKFKKVGHAGTLDPFATGLLIIGIEKGTKALNQFSALDKQYRAVIEFGVETDTYDRTGTILSQQNTEKLKRPEIEKVLAELSGQIDQIPPMYSAKKVDGVRLYKLARKNIEVSREPTQVSINDTEILSWENPFLTVLLSVSKGTYIRSYAHDLGNRLSVGARLAELQRTAIGDYQLEDSFTVNEFIRYWNESKD